MEGSHHPLAESPAPAGYNREHRGAAATRKTTKSESGGARGDMESKEQRHLHQDATRRASGEQKTRPASATKESPTISPPISLPAASTHDGGNPPFHHHYGRSHDSSHPTPDHRSHPIPVPSDPSIDGRGGSDWGKYSVGGDRVEGCPCCLCNPAEGDTRGVAPVASPGLKREYEQVISAAWEVHNNESAALQPEEEELGDEVESGSSGDDSGWELRRGSGEVDLDVWNEGKFINETKETSIANVIDITQGEIGEIGDTVAVGGEEKKHEGLGGGGGGGSGGSGGGVGAVVDAGADADVDTTTQGDMPEDGQSTDAQFKEHVRLCTIKRLEYITSKDGKQASQELVDAVIATAVATRIQRGGPTQSPQLPLSLQTDRALFAKQASVRLVTGIMANAQINYAVNRARDDEKMRVEIMAELMSEGSDIWTAVADFGTKKTKTQLAQKVADKLRHNPMVGGGIWGGGGPASTASVPVKAQRRRSTAVQTMIDADLAFGVMVQGTGEALGSLRAAGGANRDGFEHTQRRQSNVRRSSLRRNTLMEAMHEFMHEENPPPTASREEPHAEEQRGGEEGRAPEGQDAVQNDDRVEHDGVTFISGDSSPPRVRPVPRKLGPQPKGRGGGPNLVGNHVRYILRGDGQKAVSWKTGHIMEAHSKLPRCVEEIGL